MSRSIPLLSLFFRIIKCLITIILQLLLLIILAPFLALINLLYGFFQKIIRTITDKIMLFLISKLGRTPSKNTAIAKKISGPGMSK